MGILSQSRTYKRMGTVLALQSATPQLQALYMPHSAGNLPETENILASTVVQQYGSLSSPTEIFSASPHIAKEQTLQAAFIKCLCESEAKRLQATTVCHKAPWR